MSLSQRFEFIRRLDAAIFSSRADDPELGLNEFGRQDKYIQKQAKILNLITVPSGAMSLS
jgi:hypothetical protein